MKLTHSPPELSAPAATGVLLRPRLLAAFSKAIRWAQSPHRSRILLAHPPFVAAPEISMTLQPGRPLRETGHVPRRQPHFFIHEWPRQHLHSIRFPYLACLLEGEMDWRIGITQSMAKSLPQPWAQCSYVTLSFQAGQFFLMPRGVPYSNGKLIHRHQAPPETAHYKVLWLHFLPTGVFCHFSSVEKGERLHGSPLYVHDTRLHLQCEFLLEELQERGTGFEAVTHNQLHSILLCVRRRLEEQPPFPIAGGNQAWRHESAQQDVRATLADSATTVVQRACAFIEMNLHGTLRQDTIARQAAVSPSHLNRLFVKELGLPIMRYITKRRIEIAQALLTHSQLPVREIGRQIGYPNPSHFSQVFTRETRQTPQNFRAGAQPFPTQAKIINGKSKS